MYNPYNAGIFFYKPRKKRFFYIRNHHKCLSELFLLHLNMLLWVYDHYQFSILSLRGPTTDDRRQMLTSEVGPALEGLTAHMYNYFDIC